MTVVAVRVEAAPFDLSAEIAALRRLPQVGAVVTFTGVCRDENGALAALEIEHYAGMAEAEISRIVAEATRRWPLAGVSVVHRYGRIAVGDDIVLVATASTHRQEAFAAASFLMDFLKTAAPFWKREHGTSGTTGAWVAPSDDDEAAAARWRKR